MRIYVAKHADLLCFTDGSFSPAVDGSLSQMGWAVVIFLRSEGSVTCVGVLNGRVHEAFLAEQTAPNALLPNVHGPVLFAVLYKVMTCCPPTCRRKVWGSLGVRIATVKVLTLNDLDHGRGPQNTSGLARKMARPALLMQSLLEANVHVAAVQESRCEQGTVRTGEFLRFCSGSLNCRAPRVRQTRLLIWKKLAEHASRGDSTAAYAAARRLLGHKRKNPFVPEVLPMLRKLDGSLYKTLYTITAR